MSNDIKAEIYVPIDYSNLKSILPPNNDILYSTKCKASLQIKNTVYSWDSHMLIVNDGVAYILRRNKGEPKTQFFFCPWYNTNIVALTKKLVSISVKNDYRVLLMLDRDDNYETKEHFLERIRKFEDRFRPIVIEEKEKWLNKNIDNPEIKKKVIKDFQQDIKFGKKWLERKKKKNN